VQLNAFQAQSFEKRHHHFNQFRIDARRIAAAEHFRVNLIKLAVAPLLRPLAPEHRPNRVQLHRLRQLLHVALDVRTTYARRRLWPQRQRVPETKLANSLFYVVDRPAALIDRLRLNRGIESLHFSLEYSEEGFIFWRPRNCPAFKRLTSQQEKLLR